MNIRAALFYVGVVLMVVAGTRLSMHMGLSGFSSALFALFAIGIVIIATEPSRKLAERVRILEAKLAAQVQV